MGRWLISLSLTAFILSAQAEIALPDSRTGNGVLSASALTGRLAELERKVESLSRLIEGQATLIASQRSEIDSLSEELKAHSNGSHSFTASAPAPTRPTSTTRAGTEIPAVHEASPYQTPAGWTEEHAFIDSVDGNFKMEFGGRAVLDYRTYQGAETPPGSFFLRRARLKVEGRLFQHYEYEVEAELTDAATPLRDGFLNINYHPAVQIKIGQYKVPFSQEELISTKWLEFIENASLNQLVPGRSPGVQIHGELFGGKLQYQTGAFNGLGKLAANTSGVPEVYVRTRFRPFQSSTVWDDFSFGGAFGWGRHEGGESVEGSTSSRSAAFFEPVPINGRVERVNAEFAWLHSSWSLRGEFDQSVQAREGLGSGESDLPDVVGRGFLIQGTYILTGEKKIERGIVPLSPFLSDGGKGAWELALRYENIRIDDSVNPNRHQGYTLGVNWWLTRFVRVSSNFILEWFEDPERAARPGDKTSLAFLSRMQVIF